MGKILILGAGAMGTALTVPLCQNGREVNLWGTEFDVEVLEAMAKTGQHIRLGIALPRGVMPFPFAELERACQDVEIAVLAVASAGVRSVMQRLAAFLRERMIIVSVTKGLEEDPKTGKPLIMLEVIESGLPPALRNKIPVVAVGGPSIAQEVAERIPTEVIFASKDLAAAEYCRRVFTTPVYRVRVTTDVIGVELCAALKNAFAVVVGMCDGVKGKMNARVEMHNSKATLLWEAVVELAKIVQAMGGREETVLGPAGVGDLYVTAAGGRTRLFGEMLGSGMSPGEALEEMKKRHLTVEAYPAAKKGYKLAQALDKDGRLNINDLPLLKQIHAVLFEGKAAEAAIWDYFAAL